MTPQLMELLLTIRQHPAFQELLKAVEAPPLKPFAMSAVTKANEQHVEWIFRSGRALQDKQWRDFLTDAGSPQGDNPQAKE